MTQRKRQPKLDRTRHSVEDAMKETEERAATPPPVDAKDKVEVASADSMDASDPPSFTPTRAGAARHDDE